ncbi:hypothetical protein COCON_G00167610 [Conger conger]|uniref:MADF domain-containing protein n=1 Tax=Conger conger TaxID=82655 RepID=A0A9Q1D766_CONCO|nr:hypothetical protein COCON_G00167610 [Conger conger]
MDEKLILGVYEYPELYNSTLPIYRNIDRKAEAWRKIGALVGLSADEAKRKWKNLRDRYIKEIKLDRTRAGRAAHRQWRFLHFLEFLKPFVRDRQRRAGEQDYSTTSDEGDDKRLLNLPAKLEPRRLPKLEPLAVPQLAHLTQLALVTQLTPIPAPRALAPAAPGPAPPPSPPPPPPLPSPRAAPPRVLRGGARTGRGNGRTAETCSPMRTSSSSSAWLPP